MYKSILGLINRFEIVITTVFNIENVVFMS